MTGPRPQVSGEDMRQLRLALAEPGRVTPRGPGPELLISWQARAVVALGWRPVERRS